MPRKLHLIAALLAAMSGTALAMPVIYVANLSGAAESPPVVSAGTGSARVTIDDALDTMRVEVNFSGLTGNTTAAHIHCCTAVPGAGNVAVATPTPTFPGFPLGVTAGTYDQLFDMTLATSFNAAFIADNGGTTASAFAAMLTGLEEGRAYLNVHSSVFGGGEIRGFLAPERQAIPEPATMALVIGALGLMGATARRRRGA